MVDIRGFPHFSERPNIESPYLCGVMGAFYQIIQRSFAKYSPEMIKFMGDGVLAVCTSIDDTSTYVRARTLPKVLLRLSASEFPLVLGVNYRSMATTLVDRSMWQPGFAVFAQVGKFL